MNVQVTRIATKFREMFHNEIDMSDIKEPDKYENCFNSRSLAAYALVIQCGIENEVAAKCITDGYKDCGIDAVYIRMKIAKYYMLFRLNGVMMEMVQYHKAIL